METLKVLYITIQKKTKNKGSKKAKAKSNKVIK